MTLSKDTGPIEVLLVEDNPGDVRLTQEILKDSEFSLNIHLAEDGEVALAYLRNEGEHANAPRPDVILLDLAMPKKDGFQVLAEKNAAPDLRNIPVMLLTSNQVDRDHLFGMGIAPSHYCNKPLPLDRFERLIGQLGAAPPQVAPVPSQPPPPVAEPAVSPRRERRKWWPFGR